jgi:hypothetical protein
MIGTHGRDRPVLADAGGHSREYALRNTVPDSISQVFENAC